MLTETTSEAFDLHQPAAPLASHNRRMGDYPSHLARQRTLADGRRVTIRPIRAEDEPAEREFFSRTHVDYDRQMAFVCEASVDGQHRLVGEARYAANPDGRSCEFGVVIADDWHKSGIAGLLMEALIRFAQARGYETIEGLVLRDNHDMLKFVRGLGFEAAAMPEEPTLMRLVRKL
jgi:acetyltransferase